MTERMIENRIRKIQELEAQKKALEGMIESIKAEIKEDLEERGVDELTTSSYVIRWKEVISDRLDSKALKAKLPDVYKQFISVSTSRRFTVA